MANGNAAGIRSISAAERIPPHNLEAEQSLLGSMFLSIDAAEAAVLEVKATDFYRPAHAKIFSAIEQLFGRGEPIDIITVADRLEANNELESVGGKPYLFTVTNVVPTAANAMHYAGIVKRAATLRKLISAGTRIATLGYEAGDEIGEVVEDAERTLFEVTNERVQSNFRGMNDLLKKGFEQIAELAEQKRHITGVPTGFTDLDKILAGLHRGDLIILAARPSVGKTAFALNVAVNAAKENTRVAVFSLEMSSEQLIQRILCAEAAIDGQRLRTGFVGDSDWPKIMQAMGRLDKCDIYVDDTPASSILEVRSKARRLFRDGGPGLIIVDYLQLMQPQNRRSENRQVEIAEISRGLKILAKELEVPVIALSQLSRAVEQRVGKRPQLSDLRESGAIEQDADVVMFIHRDTFTRSSEDSYGGDENEGKFPPKGEAEIIVAKHRNGPVDSCNLSYQSQWTKFGNLARVH
jgi:replicative DNA helicase